MNNNILLFPINEKMIYEPHIRNNNELPFIFHNDRIRKTASPNLHENIELLYFCEGEGGVCCDSDSYSVRAGDIVAINSYVAHQVIPKGEVYFSCLIIDTGFCKENGLDVSRLTFSPLIRSTEAEKAFARVIDEYAATSAFSKMGIRAAVLDLLLCLCRNHSENRETKLTVCSHSFEYVRRSVDYIKSNFNKKLTLDSIAASVGLSKYHFLREFKKITGHTVVNYINLIRCEYAKELLESGKYNVKETAIFCGFDNLSYFTNVFKRYTGALPSAY